MNKFLASDKVHNAIEVIVFGGLVAIAAVPVVLTFAITL